MVQGGREEGGGGSIDSCCPLFSKTIHYYEPLVCHLMSHCEQSTAKLDRLMRPETKWQQPIHERWAWRSSTGRMRSEDLSLARIDFGASTTPSGVRVGAFLPTQHGIQVGDLPRGLRTEPRVTDSCRAVAAARTGSRPPLGRGASLLTSTKRRNATRTRLSACLWSEGTKRRGVRVSIAWSAIDYFGDVIRGLEGARRSPRLLLQSSDEGLFLASGVSSITLAKSRLRLKRRLTARSKRVGKCKMGVRKM